MKLLKLFMFEDQAPTEIALVHIETDEDKRAKYEAAIAAARKAMGKRLLVHPANRVQRLKEAA